MTDLTRRQLLRGLLGAAFAPVAIPLAKLLPAPSPHGQVYLFTVTQVPQRGIAWPANVKWWRGVVPGIAAGDVFNFFTRDGGATWLGHKVSTKWGVDTNTPHGRRIVEAIAEAG